VNLRRALLSRIYTNDEFNFNNSTIGSLDYNAIEKQDAVVLNERWDSAGSTKYFKVLVQKGNLIIIPSAKKNKYNISNEFWHSSELW
jgi:hypothetical protein